MAKQKSLKVQLKISVEIRISVSKLLIGKELFKYLIAKILAYLSLVGGSAF